MQDIPQKDGTFLVSLNPKIYPLEVIYSAAYVFLDRAYILLDGDPEKEINVSIRPKKDKDGGDIALSFRNELIKYCEYKTNSDRNKELRQIILQRALLSNTATQEETQEDLVCDEFLDDPEGIAIPWEEKYGDKNGPKAE